MPQPIEKPGPGRPVRLDESLLLEWEGVWIILFCCLRDGARERVVETRGSSGVFIKAHYEGESHFEDLGDEMREQKGRETIYTMVPGQRANVVRQPKIIELETKADWENKARSTQERFERLMMGDDPIRHVVPAIPSERPIWEALKRARTASAVRRAYSRSKIWLVSRRDFPSGGYQDWSWSPLPRALYREAEEFCQAKLDPRYPARDTRPYGDYRRIEYLGRVMAGLSVPNPISPSYSVDVLRKIKHLDGCKCWRCLSNIRPRFRRSLVSFLSEGMM